MITVQPQSLSNKPTPDAAATRNRVRQSPVYRDLLRLLAICSEASKQASKLADALPDSSLATLLEDDGHQVTQSLLVIANVNEVYSDLIEGVIPLF